MRTNNEISDWLNEIAEILTLKGDLLFKVNAYQKAALTVKESSRQMEDIYKQGGTKALEELEGVGESIAEKIEEFIKTGKVKELVELKKKVPSTEVQYLQIPGIGPATAKILFDKFGDLTIDKLATKLSREGSGHFKPKTINKILRGIEIYKNLGDRMTLDEALGIADPLVKFATEHCAGEKVVAVGSLRRCKETVGDIDLVATSRDPRHTIECFEKYPLFKQILGKGDTKLTAILDNGKEVDLEILPKDKYGSLLLHFTGSKQHNVALRMAAQKKGLSLSEHGFKNAKTGKLILCDDERDVYSKLGMQFIAPELRENRGEIEAAQKHQLPTLVESDDLRGDLHLHSTWSDGKASIRELAQEAKRLKYSYIAVSDHIEHMKNKKDFLQLIEKRRQEIKKVSQQEGIVIFDGCEVSVNVDGNLSLADEILEKFDFVAASIHTAMNQPKAVVTERLIKAINHPCVKMIAHPSAREINQRPPADIDWPEVFKACAKQDVALEISGQPDRLDLTDNLIIEAKKYYMRFVINTDAHLLNHMNFMKYGLATARRGWCEKKDIINTSDKNTLIKWLGKRG